MAEDRLEGALKKRAGRVQDAVSGFTGDAAMQAEGHRQTVGSAQNAYGKLVEQTDAVLGQAKGRAERLMGEAEEIIRGQPLTAAAFAIGVGVILGLLLRGPGPISDRR